MPPTRISSRWRPATLLILLALAAVAGAQVPIGPYGESNMFILNTNRVGFGDSGVVTLTGAPESVLPPAVFLSAAIPNPFNPRTTISFSVARPGPVELGIYDLRGRCLRRLVAEDLAAGRHTRQWDGRTDSDAAAPAGVYLIRLTDGSTVHARKITLVK